MNIFQGLAYAGQNLAKAADEFGQGLAKGADEFGQNFAKGAGEFGQGLAKGADEFGQNFAKGAGETIPGLLKAVDDFSRGSAKGISESCQGTAYATAEFGWHVTQGALDAAAEIQDLIQKSEGSVADLRYGVLSSLCSSLDVGCAHALRFWLEGVIGAGEGMLGGFKKALDEVSGAVHRFADENPVLQSVIVTLLALAVIQLLVPTLISALGFGSAGPIAGSWAAAWQSSLGDVEAGSIFAFLQSLGMTM